MIYNADFLKCFLYINKINYVSMNNIFHIPIEHYKFNSTITINMELWF